MKWKLYIIATSGFCIKEKYFATNHFWENRQCSILAWSTYDVDRYRINSL